MSYLGRRRESPFEKDVDLEAVYIRFGENSRSTNVVLT